MQSFTIKDIENLTGIKAHTLRIWEQRYSLFVPKRKESQHRIYDNEDLKQLLRISFLYHSGWKVSKIAHLSPDQIAAEVRNSIHEDGDLDGFINQLIEAVLDFDELRFLELLNETTQRIGFEKTIKDVCYPFLTKIGHLWSTNNVIPAQEHFTSYIIQNRIIVETEKLGLKPGLKPSIILCAPKGEYHELPLLYLNYLFRKHGWGTLYMGTNTSPKELEQLSEITGISHLYLHLITNFTGQDTDDFFESICRKFPGKKIVASGEGIRKAQRNFVNLRLLRTDQEIYSFIESAPK